MAITVVRVQSAVIMAKIGTMVYVIRMDVILILIVLVIKLSLDQDQVLLLIQVS